MPLTAPLCVSVRVELESGEAAGERRHRLSSALELPARLHLDGGLPVAGVGGGRVRFALPDADGGELALEATAELSFDPEAVDGVATATLLELDDVQLQALERYVKERLA
jgi:hypothetical protein